MAGFKEELIKATDTFDVVRALNEARLRPLKAGGHGPPMTTQEVADELNVSKQTIFRTLKIGMSRLYSDVKKQFNANPAQVIKILIDFYNADAEEVMSYLDADKEEEVRAYVKEHGVY